MELHELEVGQRRPGGVRQQQAAADGAGRIGRARPQCGGAAGGEHHGAAGDQPAVVEADADAAIVGDDQLDHAPPLEHVDARMLSHHGAQLSHQPPAGRGPAGVDDPAPRVTTLEAEREVPAPVGVEPDAEPAEVRHRRGRLVAEDPGGRLADGATAGDDRVA